MPKISIDRERCKGCLLCISFCPQGSIQIDNHFNRQGIKPVKFSLSEIPKHKTVKVKSPTGFTDNRECIGCMQCALICPDCCIEVLK
jgi:2-oxoglutarate ferredoxin oxidoreductase subunit delta